MHYSELRPLAPLDRWVRCFWFLSGSGGGEPQPVVPDGRLEIIIHRADPFGQVLPGGTVQPQQSVMVSGQITRPVMLSPSGHADIIGIRFRTAAARDLLGLPLAELTNRVVALHEVSSALAARLEHAASSEDPLGALTAVLLEQQRASAHVSTAAAVVRLAEGESIFAVARALGSSIRTLERRVREDTGLAPKTLQRVLRFRRFYTLLQSGSTSGARAAAGAGYYDQAHANRDFRRFAGSSPTEHFGTDPHLALAMLSHSS
jgi:AraC-like DNA-binding protein